MTTATQIRKGDQFYYMGHETPMLGTVIALTSYAGKQIGLEFEGFSGGHSCDGRGKDGQCLWSRPWFILTPVEYQAKVDADAANSIKDTAQDLEVLEL
jgi:hypothetical protein